MAQLSEHPICPPRYARPRSPRSPRVDDDEVEGAAAPAGGRDCPKVRWGERHEDERDRVVSAHDPPQPPPGPTPGTPSCQSSPLATASVPRPPPRTHHHSARRRLSDLCSTFASPAHAVVVHTHAPTRRSRYVPVQSWARAFVQYSETYGQLWFSYFYSSCKIMRYHRVKS